MTAAERRDAVRQPFICSAELVEIGGSTRIAARTSDLSATGCYIDTLNPFPVGTQVLLRLTKTDRPVEFQARVTSSHVGSGMGLLFENLTPEQKRVLSSWLQERTAPEDSPFRAVAPPQSPSPATPANNTFAMRLLKILERKGVLTHSEAAELLRDLNS